MNAAGTPKLCRGPTDEEVEGIVGAVASVVMKELSARGYLPSGDADDEIASDASWIDAVFAQSGQLAAALSASSVLHVAFGERAGRKVRRIGRGFGCEDDELLPKGRRCFSLSVAENISMNGGPFAFSGFDGAGNITSFRGGRLQHLLDHKVGLFLGRTGDAPYKTVASATFPDKVRIVVKTIVAPVKMAVDFDALLLLDAPPRVYTGTSVATKILSDRDLLLAPTGSGRERASDRCSYDRWMCFSSGEIVKRA